MKQLYISILRAIGLLFSFVYPSIISKWRASLLDKIYTGYIQRRFAHFGKSIIMWHPYTLRGLEHIRIGDGTVIECDLQLTTQKTGKHNPQITIGNNCMIRRGAHITAINSISIGDALLTGTNVFITDNSHGDSTIESLSVSPCDRQILSKGPVNIGNNVWLGNNVCVLPGVTIGDGVVIGANSIVTHDIPAYCVAAGIPAKVIKEVGNKTENDRNI